MDCETCCYYSYDEDTEGSVCAANMDEDDFVRFLSQGQKGCPYYRREDEYGIVRHQN